MTRTWMAGLLAAGLGVSLSLAGTICVDASAAGGPPGNGSPELPFATIQEGINAALPGDEVVVADGTYAGPGNKNLDFFGKAITVRSASGDPALCIIDCEHDGRGFFFHSAETDASVVSGFTIRNGHVSSGGGGVYCVASGPTLADCTITGNSASAYGGGVYSSGHLSRPALTRCRITANSAPIGGGVYCDSDTRIVLTDCTIQGNAVTSTGGGVYCRLASRVRLTRCAIVGNSASSGAGVYCYSASPRLTNCLLGGNTASQSGGAVVCSNASGPTLVNCAIVGNVAGSDGAGVQCRSSSNPTLVSCTITENNAHAGGAVACGGYSSPTLTNCILWSNVAMDFNVTSGSPLVTYCDVFGGWYGDGNIDADPLFVRPPSAGDDGQWGTADDDYGDLHLTAGTACIDAGDNVNPPRDGLDLDNDGCDTEPMPVDLDGFARYVDDPETPDTGRGAAPLVDMGVYEFGATAPPAPGGPCPGDLNCDGLVDAGDINPFVLYLSNHAAWLTTFAGCDPRNGDTNNDGTYGQECLDDINPFVAILSTR